MGGRETAFKKKNKLSVRKFSFTLDYIFQCFIYTEICYFKEISFTTVVIKKICVVKMIKDTFKII